MVSAFRIPTILTWSKSSPFDTICVPQSVYLFSLFPKIGDNLFIGNGYGSIQIHVATAASGKRTLSSSSIFFRSKPLTSSVPSQAGQDSRQLIGIAAIMACQLVDSLMISQAHIAKFLHFGTPAASTTFYHRCKSAAILKENDLFFLLRASFMYCISSGGTVLPSASLHEVL